MRKAILLAIAPFLVSATLAAESPSAPAAAVCSPAPGRRAVALADRVELRPGGVVLAAAGRRIDALGCADDALVAATSEAGRKPRAARIAMGPDGARTVLETALPGRAVAVAATADRIAAACAVRNGGALVVAGAGGFRRETPLPGPPSALAASPDGTAVFVAVGKELRAFRLDTGGTWIVLTFDAPVTAAAFAPDGTRMVVAVGPRLDLIDVAVRTFRGVPPRLASADLDGVPRWVGLSRGGAVAALVGAKALLFDARDLSPLGEFAVDPAAAGLALDADAAWIDAGGALREAPLPAPSRARPAPAPPRPAPPPPEAPAAAPRPEPAPPAPPQPQPPSAAQAPTPKPQPPPAAQAPVAKPQAPPAAQPPVAKPQAPPAAQPPTPKPQPPPVAQAPTPKPQAAPVAPPRPPSEPRPATTEAPKPATPAPAPPPAPREEPPAPREEQPAAEAAPPPAPPSPPRPPQAEAPIPEGAIVGTIAGRADLAAEIVVAGPDNVLAVAARQKPRMDGPRAVFRVEGLRPGRYRIVAMGANGASLATTPAWAEATLRPGAGARVEIRVDGAL